MSLKAVHIFFVAVATLAMLGFSLYALREYQAVGGGSYLLIALLGLAGTVTLPVYGLWFLRKLKKVGFV